MQPSALIIGSSGLVAPALANRLRAASWNVVQTSRSGAAHIPFDLDNPELAALPAKVQAVFLVAAETSLRRCEEMPERARQVNAVVPAAIAGRYAGQGARIIALSTNLVFDGEVAQAKVDSLRHPQCVYGKSKAELEDCLLALDAPVAIVRLTKIAETLRPLLRQWSEALQAGTAIAPFDDMVCSPVSLASVIDVLVHLGQSNERGVFHVSGTTDLSYAAIARHLCSRMAKPSSLVQPAPATSATVAIVSQPKHTTLASKLPAGVSSNAASDLAAVDAVIDVG